MTDSLRALFAIFSNIASPLMKCKGIPNSQVKTCNLFSKTGKSKQTEGWYIKKKHPLSEKAQNRFIAFPTRRNKMKADGMKGDCIIYAGYKFLCSAQGEGVL